MQKVERESAAPPKPPKFKVGQIAVYDRAKKRSIPVIILQVISEFDTYFYRVDRKNAVAESMLREMNGTELGERRIERDTAASDMAEVLDELITKLRIACDPKRTDVQLVEREQFWQIIDKAKAAILKARREVGNAG